MASAVLDLVDEFAIDQGSIWVVDLQLTLNGVPRNLGTPIAYSGRAQIRTSPEDATVVADVTVTILDAALGKIRMSLKADSTTMEAGTYVYDLEIYLAGDELYTRETVIRGKVKVVAQVTRT